jgi:hypothetical protein
VAPSAFRMPNSRVRVVTTCRTTPNNPPSPGPTRAAQRHRCSADSGTDRRANSVAPDLALWRQIGFHHCARSLADRRHLPVAPRDVSARGVLLRDGGYTARPRRSQSRSCREQCRTIVKAARDFGKWVRWADCGGRRRSTRRAQSRQVITATKGAPAVIRSSNPRPCDQHRARKISTSGNHAAFQPLPLSGRRPSGATIVIA